METNCKQAWGVLGLWLRSVRHDLLGRSVYHEKIILKHKKSALGAGNAFSGRQTPLDNVERERRQIGCFAPYCASYYGRLYQLATTAFHRDSSTNWTRLATTRSWLNNSKDAIWQSVTLQKDRNGNVWLEWLGELQTICLWFLWKICA